MPSQSLFVNKENVVQVLLGQNAPVIASNKWNINQHITLQTWTIESLAKNMPKQFGQVLCANNNANERSLQLLYLQHNASDNAFATIISLFFEPAFLQQWDEQMLFAEEAFNENNAGFQIPFCAQTEMSVNKLLAFKTKTNFAEKLRQMEYALMLISKAVEYVGAASDTSFVPACSFLNNNTEREKVLQAHDILTQEYDQMISIKELSKRVAINECYLKKGFKAMFGKTVNEFQQQMRIAKAKLLLQTDGYTVSEVANTLGYSSISHFSTAFKKATNMKPCELLK